MKMNAATTEMVNERNCGERHGNARLKNRDIEEIRTRFKMTDGPRGDIVKQLSQQFGVSVRQIRNICFYYQWKHLP